MTLWRVAYAIVPTAEVGICKEGEIQKDTRPASGGQVSAVEACCREKEAALRRETRGQTQKDRPRISGECLCPAQQLLGIVHVAVIDLLICNEMGKDAGVFASCAGDHHQQGGILDLIDPAGA